jgi:hypothetical protein
MWALGERVSPNAPTRCSEEQSAHSTRSPDKNPGGKVSRKKPSRERSPYERSPYIILFTRSNFDKGGRPSLDIENSMSIAKIDPCLHRKDQKWDMVKPIYGIGFEPSYLKICPIRTKYMGGY